MEVCCKHCGCNDVRIISEPDVVAPQENASIAGQPWVSPGRAECNHCGRLFTFTNDGPGERTRPLTYELYCPNCNSPDTKVASSPAPEGGFKTRHIECNNCKHDFKTIDRVNPMPNLHTR